MSNTISDELRKKLKELYQSGYNIQTQCHTEKSFGSNLFNGLDVKQFIDQLTKLSEETGDPNTTIWFTLVPGVHDSCASSAVKISLYYFEERPVKEIEAEVKKIELKRQKESERKKKRQQTKEEKDKKLYELLKKKFEHK